MIRTLCKGMGLALLVPLLSYGISRVGNGIVKDPRIGFTAETPAEYSAHEVEGGGLRFSALRKAERPGQGAAYLIGGFPGVRIENPVVTFELRAFDELYADLTGLEVPALRERLLGKGFRKVETTQECTEAFLAESRTDYTLVTVWGKGLGTVMIGEKSATVLRGMLGIVNTTHAVKGNCPWN